MNKKIIYKLNNKTLPVIPALHNEKIENITMESDDIIITANLSNQVILKDKLGFVPNKVRISADLLDDAACDVEITKTVRKKELKEKSKLGYGRKVNVYAIRDFLQIYKNYPLYFNSVMVGEGKVIISFDGKPTIKIKVIISCEEIAYNFSE